MSQLYGWKLQTYLQCKKCVRRALLIASEKPLARITAIYNSHAQGPVSFHSCLASENTNMRKRCYLWSSEKDRKSNISCKDCQQSICGEHSVNLCHKCRKLDIIIMFTYTFLKKNFVDILFLLAFHLNGVSRRECFNCMC